MLTLVITRRTDYMRVSYKKVRTREGGNITPSECLAVLAARRLVEKFLDTLLAVTWEHTKIMENLGVITIPEFSCFGLRDARDRASAQRPVIKCNLSRAQSKLH